jgi:hypothetical protein
LDADRGSGADGSELMAQAATAQVEFYYQPG